MTAAVRLRATKMDGHGYSHEEAWDSLWMRGDAAVNATFHTTARKLMREWNRSAYWVMEFLKRLEVEGTIKRRILRDNGGTLITITSQSASYDEPAEQMVSVRTVMSGHICQLIENLPSVLSAWQADRLSRAYKGIVYGEPGYEWATIEHLEIIEQALFPSQMQQAA